jgi:tetratricopeptide (TPR) repeat protein
MGLMLRWLLMLPMLYQGLWGAVTGQAPAIKTVPGKSPMADLSLGGLAEYRKPPPERVKHTEALAHYAAALQLERAGKGREALDHYLGAVKADPGQPDLALHAAELALSYISRERAIQILEECVTTSPDSPDAALNLANFYATYPPDKPESVDKPHEVLKAALSRFPGSAEVYRTATMIYLTRNQRARAEEAMEQALKQPSTRPEFWLVTGRAAQEVWPLAHSEHKVLHRGKVNPFFENALRVAPVSKRPDVHLDVAQYFLLSAQLERSGQIVEALHKATGDLQAARLLVRIYQARDLDDEALVLLEKIVKAVPEDVEQRRLAAGIYTEKREYAKAVPHLEAIIRIAGGSVDDYRVLANLLLFSGEWEKTLGVIQRTKVLFPNDPDFPYVAARALEALERREEALDYYLKAEVLAQATAPEGLTDGFYASWGNVLQQLKRHDEAARKYQRAINLVPESEPKRSASILNNLGYMWLELNKNLDQAGEFIQRACEFDPESYVYQDSLGWFYYMKGRYPEALKALLEAEKLMTQPERTDSEIYDHIGRTYEKLGKPDLAATYYDKALKLDPKNEGILGRKAALEKSQPPAR